MAQQLDGEPGGAHNQTDETTGPTQQQDASDGDGTVADESAAPGGRRAVAIEMGGIECIETIELTHCPNSMAAMVRFTRCVDAVIAPILAAAGVILFFYPGQTDRLWAWTLQPQMSAMTVGAGYFGGVWFFVRALLDRRPYRVVAGLAAATPFTAMLLIATFLHWNRFHHRNFSFLAWLALYLVTPFLLPTLAVANRRDPSNSTDDPHLPRFLRRMLAVLGVSQIGAALAWFVAPNSVIDHWPWKMTPLALRTIAGFVVFTGVMLVWPLIDDRAGAVRIGIESVLIGMTLTGVAALLDHHEFVGPRSSVIGYSVMLGAVLVVVATSLVVMARQIRSTSASADGSLA